MKSLNFLFNKIFHGLYSGERFDIDDPELEECHNLEPVSGDYKVHEIITDMNADGISWSGSGEEASDIWRDHEDDDFIDHDSDNFADLVERNFLDAFIFTVTTVTTPDTFTLPLEASGTYDFYIDWGDGDSDEITAYNDAAVTHTYSTPGTYTIRISGTINGFRFGNSGDRTLLTEIKQWGSLLLGNTGGYFHGCINLTISATDILNLAGTTNLSAIFRNCDSIVTVPSINSWDTSSVTRLYMAFADMLLFNQALDGWDTSSVTDMASVFYEAVAFNQPLTGWDTSSVNSFAYMFYYANSFDQDLSSWDVTSVEDMSGMFDNMTLSTANYDALLIGWEAQDVQDNVTFDGGNSTYTGGGAAEAARAALIADHSWTITDGGVAP